MFLMSEKSNDISLIDFIITLFRYKLLIACIVISFIISALLYNANATPIYESEASFFITPQTSASTGGGSIMGYAKVFGIDLPSNITKFIFAILQSGKMRAQIVNDMESTFPNASRSEIFEALNFKDSFSIKKDKYDTFVISFQNKSPDVAQKVIISCLDNLTELNKELNIAAQKEFFTILDSPTSPSKPIKPRKILNLILAIVGSTSFAIFLVFFIEYIKSELKLRNHHE